MHLKVYSTISLCVFPFGGLLKPLSKHSPELRPVRVLLPERFTESFSLLLRRLPVQNNRQVSPHTIIRSYFSHLLDILSKWVTYFLDHLSTSYH
ncbi:hypothetical protein B4134_2369 [Bacillus safensis]|nr:hypothetical protein B4134_2369 [Bacillus safensis]